MLFALLFGCALAACGGAERATPISPRAAHGESLDRPEAKCAARYEAAVAVAEATCAQHQRVLAERTTRIAEGRREAEARVETARRSDNALRRWVVSHLALKKLPCEPSGSDYEVGLRVTSRALAPLACELDEIGSGLAAPTARKHATVEPGQTAKLDTVVRTCAAVNAAERRRFVLLCQLSLANREEARIEDPSWSWFVYDLDSLELEGPPLPTSVFVEPPVPSPPSPAPERARFLEQCLAAPSP